VDLGPRAQIAMVILNRATDAHQASRQVPIGMAGARERNRDVRSKCRGSFRR
jgi:hypothetical protein